MSAGGDLPSYDELPVSDGAPAGSAWGLWGPDDVHGCLNLLTPDRVVRAASLVRTGEVFALNWEMELPDPPLFGRSAFTHRVLGLGGDIGHDEELDGWNTQSSSQWDGFRHIRSLRHGFFNGVADEEHGVHHWARRGIAGRGVLADVARWREHVGRPLRVHEPDPIEPDDLLATLDWQGVASEPGDVLLLRTGWIGWYRTLDDAARRALPGGFACAGLRPGRATARVLWDLHIAAVASDNLAVEVWPSTDLVSPEQRRAAREDPDELPEVFVHTALLPLLGLPIGEMFDLDALAAACARDGVYEFLFTSAPLNLRGGVASPPNALALR